MNKLNRKVVWVWFFGNIFRNIFGFIFLFFFTSTIFSVFWEAGFFGKGTFFDYVVSNPNQSLSLFFVFVLFFSYVHALLSYHFYKYELADIGLKQESGIIWKVYTTIPYNRIQNIDIFRGLLARSFGISDLQIHTAGVGGVAVGEGRLPGLSMEDAELLREEILKRAQNSRQGQGL